jgi:hypothetical protein
MAEPERNPGSCMLKVAFDFSLRTEIATRRELELSRLSDVLWSLVLCFPIYKLLLRLKPRLCLPKECFYLLLEVLTPVQVRGCGNFSHEGKQVVTLKLIEGYPSLGSSHFRLA